MSTLEVTSQSALKKFLHMTQTPFSFDMLKGATRWCVCYLTRDKSKVLTKHYVRVCMCFLQAQSCWCVARLKVLASHFGTVVQNVGPSPSHQDAKSSACAAFSVHHHHACLWRIRIKGGARGTSRDKGLARPQGDLGHHA